MPSKLPPHGDEDDARYIARQLSDQFAELDAEDELEAADAC